MSWEAMGLIVLVSIVTSLTVAYVQYRVQLYQALRADRQRDRK